MTQALEVKRQGTSGGAGGSGKVPGSEGGGLRSTTRILQDVDEATLERIDIGECVGHPRSLPFCPCLRLSVLCPSATAKLKSSLAARTRGMQAHPLCCRCTREQLAAIVSLLQSLGHSGAAEEKEAETGETKAAEQSGASKGAGNSTGYPRDVVGGTADLPGDADGDFTADDDGHGEGEDREDEASVHPDFGHAVAEEQALAEAHAAEAAAAEAEEAMERHRSSPVFQYLTSTLSFDGEGKRKRRYPSSPLVTLHPSCSPALPSAC